MYHYYDYCYNKQNSQRYTNSQTDNHGKVVIHLCEAGNKTSFETYTLGSTKLCN